jgi:hypothetical protein
MMFLVETPFCHFCPGNDGNKFSEKYHGSFYGEEADLDERGDERPPGSQTRPGGVAC